MQRLNIQSLFLLVSILLLSNASPAQDLDLSGTTLEDLLNVKTTVATKKEVSVHSTPGIITVITDQEIHDMGARDLIDVLRLVPSVNFNYDVQGVVGMSVRGIWAYEGKYALIVDGVEMNEPAYGTTQFGNEFPVDQIKRIEIIRGPGSAIYGGFAELAVFNITTKSGGDLKGASSELTYGRMVGGSERKNLSVTFGGKSNDWEYSFGAYGGVANRGEGTYTGYNPLIPASGSIDFKNADVLTPTYFNFGLKKGTLNFRVIDNDYKLTTATMYNYSNSGFNFLNEFRMFAVVADYTYNVNSKLKITPQIKFSDFEPWRQTEPELISAGYGIFDLKTQRTKTSITASYEASKNANLLAGFEYLNDHDWAINYAGTNLLEGGKHSQDFNSRATYTQLLYNLPQNFNLAIGARYENPNFTRDSFLPRVGLTKESKKWHSKVLYSEAFRTPALQNIEVHAGILPEKTSTFEIEYGFETSQSSYLTANLYDTLIENPIIYSVSPTGSDEYDNFSKVGTHGLELDYRLRKIWGQMQLSYSYYEVTSNGVPKFAVAQTKSALAGEPQHKVSLNSSVVLLKKHNIKLNPSLVYMSHTYGYEYDSALGAMALKPEQEHILFNLFLSRDDILLKGLSGGVGIFNILNQNARYIQPYGGSGGEHSPLPAPSREIVAKLDYKMSF